MSGLRTLCSPTTKARDLQALRGWRDPDSNRGHHDFQSCALPTELSRLGRAMLARSWCGDRAAKCGGAPSTPLRLRNASATFSDLGAGGRPGAGALGVRIELQ